MLNRVIIISVFVACIFGYVTYEAIKLDNKLSSYKEHAKNNKNLTTLPDVSFKYFGKKTKEFNLKQSAQKGNYLLVHFWGTWCGPCEAEFPELVQLTEKYKDKKNVKFLFVAVNDDVKKVKKFLKKFKNQLNFVLLVDNDFIHQNHFNTFKLPETYLFSPKGVLIQKYVGPQKWMQPEMIKQFNQI